MVSRLRSDNKLIQRREYMSLDLIQRLCPFCQVTRRGKNVTRNQKLILLLTSAANNIY